MGAIACSGIRGNEGGLHGVKQLTFQAANAALLLSCRSSPSTGYDDFLRWLYFYIKMTL